VSLRVYDISGRNVRTLVQGRQGPGHYPVVWNGRDDRDQQLASGVYFGSIWRSAAKMSRPPIFGSTMSVNRR